MRKDHRNAFDSFPFKIVNTKFPYKFYLGQDPSSESYDDHLQLDVPQEIKTNPTASVHTPTPRKIPDRYKPLILPPILHLFLEKYYKYLPRFDGEYGNITAEKHIQSFENFLDLFEVDEDELVPGSFLYLFKAKPRNGSKTCQLQVFLISINL